MRSCLTAREVIVMARIPGVRRSQGAASGVLLVLLGLWGGLVPFLGPYFHYAYTPDRPWVATAGRVWLEVLPAFAAVLGGAVMLTSRSRLGVVGGAFLASLAGIWFATGTLVSAGWARLPAAGTPAGGSSGRILAEQLGFHTGLGLVIVLVAAAGAGRVSVRAAIAEPEPEGWDEPGQPDAGYGPAPQLGAEPPWPRALETGAATRSVARVVPVPAVRGRSRGPVGTGSWTAGTGS